MKKLIRNSHKCKSYSHGYEIPIQIHNPGDGVIYLDIHPNIDDGSNTTKKTKLKVAVKMRSSLLSRLKREGKTCCQILVETEVRDGRTGRRIDQNIHQPQPHTIDMSEGQLNYFQDLVVCDDNLRERECQSEPMRLLIRVSFLWP